MTPTEPFHALYISCVEGQRINIKINLSSGEWTAGEFRSRVSGNNWGFGCPRGLRCRVVSEVLWKAEKLNFSPLEFQTELLWVNSVAFAAWSVSHLSLWRGKWCSRRSGKCSSEAGMGPAAVRMASGCWWCPQPHPWDKWQELQLGAKQGCSSSVRVCGAGMEPRQLSKGSRSEKTQQKRSKVCVKWLQGQVWMEWPGLSAWGGEGSSRTLLVVCKTEEISQHMWISDDGACRLQKI